MNHRSKFLFRNLGILTLSNFASKLLVFLLVPLYTSVLSTTEYGVFDIVISTSSLLFPLLTANIVDAVMRFVMDKAYSKDEVASIGVKYISVSILLVGCALMISNVFNVMPSIAGIRLYIFLFYFANVFNQFFVQYAKGIEKIKDMGIASILGTMVMIGANILFLLVLKTGLIGFFVANILAQFVPVVYYFLRLKFWKTFYYIRINKTLEREMIAYSFPLVCTSLGWWVNNAADKYVVTWLYGIAANGVLSVAYKIPSIITTLHGIFNQAWQISAIKEHDNKEAASFYGKMFNHLNVFMCMACSFLILTTKAFAHYLYANEFYEAWQYVPFLLISTVINFSSGFIGPILAAKKNTKAMAVASIYGMVTNIILNIILVYTLGVQGATIATVISSFIIYYYRKKAVKDDLIIDKYWRVIVTWFFLWIQALIEIYASWWYIEVVIMLTIIIVNKDRLKEIIQILFKRDTL